MTPPGAGGLSGARQVVLDGRVCVSLVAVSSVAVNEIVSPMPVPPSFPQPPTAVNNRAKEAGNGRVADIIHLVPPEADSRHLLGSSLYSRGVCVIISRAFWEEREWSYIPDSKQTRHPP